MVDRDIYHIVSDYFRGRITGPDLEYMNIWLDESPHNKQTFAELERVWKLTGALQSNVNSDIDLEWNRFVKARESVILEPPTKNTFWTRPMLIAAAFIPAFLVVASLFFIFHKGSNKEEWLTVNTGNNKVQQILPDGTEVWINRNSTLSYPKEFHGKTRTVRLTGEGFFSVVKNKGSFVIEAGASEVKVLGTQFVVRNYASERTTEVLVKEGKVSFSSRNDKNVIVILTSGEKGILDASINEIQKETATDSNQFAWVTQNLTYNNTPISQMGKDVARYFNTTVIVSPSLKNIMFAGTFTNPRLEEVLRTLSVTINCDYKIKNDTVFIESK